jgi:hypothetical protein
MAENSGVALDFLTQIVNVQWSGLAVEFGPRDEDAPRPLGASTISASPASQKTKQ